MILAWALASIAMADETPAGSGWAPPSAVSTGSAWAPPSDDSVQSGDEAEPPDTPIPESLLPGWAKRINYYRATAGLRPIRDVPDVSASIQAHARYLMKNFVAQIRGTGSLGEAAFTEDPKRSGYSRDGAAVASNSQIAWGCGTLDTDRQIDRWIAGPFHRFAMLNPSLRQGGFGEASADGCWAAALRLLPSPEKLGPYAKPVEFPPDGGSVSLEYMGGEFPNPAASCAGYPEATGLPITLQIGRVVDIKLGANSLTEDGKPVEHCTFDAKTYRNPNRDGQEYGRWALRSNGAIVMIPRAPLHPGAHYKVSIAANGKIYSWQFQAAN